MRHFVSGVLILIGLCAPGLVPTLAQADPQAVASLEPLRGVVQVQTAQDDPADAWQTISDPVVVAEGDRIRTGADSAAILTFFEGVESTLGPSTLAVVSTLDLPDDDASSITLDVLVGNTLTSVDAVLDAGDRVEIYTLSASAVVRGTRWWTVVSPQGEVTFFGERGTVGILAHRPGAVLRELRERGVLRVDRQGVISELPDDTPRPVLLGRGPLARRTCGDDVCQRGERLTCPADCRADLDLSACGDGICDLDAPEDLLVCPQDCGPWAGELCGNGTCDADERALTCPADCQ